LVGEDNYFSFNDIFKYINFMHDFNVFENTFSGRFRPSFQLIRMFELYLFDANVFLYQALRFIIFYVFLLIVIIQIINYNGLLYGSLISLILLMSNYWSDIFTRIITSEFYVLLGLVFFIPACFKVNKVIKEKHNSTIFIYLIAVFYLLSGLIVMGSKENFIFLIIIPIYFTYLLYKNKFFNFSIIFANIMLIIFPIIITFIMLDFFLFTKENVSGFGQFNYFIIFKLIYKFLKIFILDWFFIFTILLVLITLLKSKNREILIKSKTRILALLKTFFPCFFLIVVLLIFQLTFYTAQIPTGMRYDFPALFLFIIFCTWQIKLIEQYLLILGYNYSHIRNLILVYLFSCILIFNPMNFYKQYQDSLKHKNNTIAFNATIANIVKHAKSFPEKNIIINTHNVWDYELIFSINRFLNYYNIKNPMYLKVHFKKNDYSTSVEHEFVNRIVKISNGLAHKGKFIFNEIRQDWKYSPIKELVENRASCISTNIDKKEDIYSCDFHLILEYNGH
jgi:hypothetical protein